MRALAPNDHPPAVPPKGEQTTLEKLHDGLTSLGGRLSEWTRTFTDPRLCAAIADRLTCHSTIIETGTDSYRLAHARVAR